MHFTSDVREHFKELILIKKFQFRFVKHGPTAWILRSQKVRKLTCPIQLQQFKAFQESFMNGKLIQAGRLPPSGLMLGSFPSFNENLSFSLEEFYGVMSLIPRIFGLEFHGDVKH